ncbi:DUF2059 domain-containing protein [Eikenella sp. S3360]|uniref:DUF2059 domain-containing protein n=1 Tax=Eikenella glucosivorans TaxID=2766967 RepID=A0ABS0NCS3_9NEIS|nr:DUF2059 domain-containing protein [Eikenella glucosivorans]MBH5330107.1 DUF2059 domain-containing protein [Eikenella glucosivorans]
MSKTALPLLRVAALGLLLAALPAAAQTPSDESLNRLIELQGTREQMLEALSTNSTSIKQGIIEEINSDKNLTRSQQAALIQAINRYNDNLYREVFSQDTWNEINKISRNFMRQLFTQEEVDAMIAFYSTPIGQSSTRKQYELASIMMPSMHNLFRQRIDQANRHLLPEYKREVERIIRQSSPSNTNIDPVRRVGSGHGTGGYGSGSRSGSYRIPVK